MSASVIVDLPLDLAAIAGCARVAVGKDEDGLFLVTREGETERLRCFNVHQEGVIDLLARSRGEVTSGQSKAPRVYRVTHKQNPGGYRRTGGHR